MFMGANMPDLRLAEDEAIELAEIFRLLGDGNRLRIAVACLGEALCVSDIAQRVGLSPSLVSHHLRLLRAARFVKAERRGKQVFYGAVDEHVKCVIQDMVGHVAEQRDGAEEEDYER